MLTPEIAVRKVEEALSLGCLAGDSKLEVQRFPVDDDKYLDLLIVNESRHSILEFNEQDSYKIRINFRDNSGNSLFEIHNELNIHPEPHFHIGRYRERVILPRQVISQFTQSSSDLIIDSCSRWIRESRE